MSLAPTRPLYRLLYTVRMSWAAAVLLIAITLPILARVLPWLLAWIPAAPVLAVIWLWERRQKPKPPAHTWPHDFKPYKPK